jgi:hypothetical protein
MKTEFTLACLGAEEAADLSFSVHELAEICNRSVLVDYVIKIDKDTIVNAYTNGGEQVYSYPFQDLRPGCGNTSNLLHVHLSHRFERGGICNSFIGRFTSKEKVLVATKELEQCRAPILQIDFEVHTSLRDKCVNLLKKREERRQKDSQTASNKRCVA